MPTCHGKVELIRFADDFLVLAEFQEDAIRLDNVLRTRLGKFGLDVAEEKTRTIPFGRQAWRSGRKSILTFSDSAIILERSNEGKWP